jgi:nucleotide-binding universal stress UspA family protein
MPLQKYLVPLDGSLLAEHAIPLAAERAKRLDGSLVLVRVVNPVKPFATAAAGTPGMEPVTPVEVEALTAAIEAEERDARAYLQRKAEELSRDGFRVSWEVRSGQPAEEIIAAAKTNGVDVIVISTHGRSGLGRLVFGSVADQVIRAGAVPVLVYNSR